MPAVPMRWEDLTPRWMTAALAGSFPGAVVDRVTVASVGHGTNSRARLVVDYASGSGPRTLFLKGPGRPGNRLALAVLGAWATEARLAAAGSQLVLPLHHPALYAGAVDPVRLASVVLMEDVTASGGRPNEGVQPLSVAEVRDGLEGLARLHARYLERPWHSALAFLRPWRLGPVWAAVSVANLAAGLHRYRADGPGASLPAQVTAAGLGGQFARWARLAATGPQTLLHGDPHPANTYAVCGPAPGTGPGTGFYDWQLARTGHWSHDVGYFLAGSLSPDDRRTHERTLLDGYLRALGAATGTEPDPVDAWDRYRASQAFGLATWLHTLSFGTFQPAERCTAMVTRYAVAYAELDTPQSPAWGSG